MFFKLEPAETIVDVHYTTQVFLTPRTTFQFTKPAKNLEYMGAQEQKPVMAWLKKFLPNFVVTAPGCTAFDVTGAPSSCPIPSINNSSMGGQLNIILNPAI